MKKWIVFTIAIVLFIIMAYLVSNGLTGPLDSLIYNFVTVNKSNTLTYFFKFITFFANEYAILLVTIICFILFKNKKYAITVFITALCTVFLNYILKITFMRDRPFDLMIIDEKGYSFPSGHAMVSIGFYGYILYLVWQTKADIKYKKVITISLCILIILIGMSRIYLGVHYPSDIIGGYSVAIVYLILYIEIIKRKVING